MRNLAEFSGGSAIRYFTLTRRKNEVGAPAGETVVVGGMHKVTDGSSVSCREAK